MTLLAAARRRQSDSHYPLPEPGTLTVQPTYDGSGETIHPSVVDMLTQADTTPSGYRWWMADTPYPGRNDRYENPSIWASNDRIHWTVPAGVTNPIAPAPDEPHFNADTDLIWNPDLEELFVTWRTGADGNALKLASTTTGITWTTYGNVATFASSDNAKSPTLVRVTAGQWRMYGMGTRETGVHMWTAATPYGPWTKYGNITMDPIPYHGQIIPYEGAYIGLCSAVFDSTYNLIPYASPDGLTWYSGATIPIAARPYRPTIVPSTEPGQIDAWISEEQNQRVRYYRFADSVFLDLLP